MEIIKFIKNAFKKKISAQKLRKNALVITGMILTPVKNVNIRKNFEHDLIESYSAYESNPLIVNKFYPEPSYIELH